MYFVEGNINKLKQHESVLFNEEGQCALIVKTGENNKPLKI